MGGMPCKNRVVAQKFGATTAVCTTVSVTLMMVHTKLQHPVN